VQFAHSRPLEQDETERHDANRIAEAVIGALAYEDMAVFLDNFIGIERGYYFSGGLVDRLYSPLSGAHIVRHLHAALPDGCKIGAMIANGNDRLIELGETGGVLLLPAADPDPATPQSAPSRTKAHWIDLANGKTAPERLLGPTLVIPK
jgi:hypothetical protein